jgi:dihydroorotate dehydrogenase (NAD+) catalytic subunit
VSTPSVLATSACGLDFRNPVVLAAGTAAYGRELEGVVDLDAIGGFVTKAVSRQPRHGAPSPRVSEFRGGMINAVGLANPGVEAVIADHLPWLAATHPGTRRLANIVGFAVDEFAQVVEALEAGVAATPGGTAALDGYEINVSCPNVKAGGMEFGADAAALAAVIGGVRAVTRRPLFVKLSPTLPAIADVARRAVDAGADGLTLVNTLPGLVVDVERRVPALGFGSGGMSGGAILPAGVLATWRVSRAVTVPVLGIGGIRTAEDALQYIIAGATLVGVGTEALRDPRQPGRIVRGLAQWCQRHGVRSIRDLTGTLQWPA